jgi:type IV pilus biogenesis protein CpaD/CtpE
MKRIFLAMVLVSLAACAETEPFQNPYRWAVTGSNAANLAAMAEPDDLVHGRGLQGSDGQPAVAAIDRWRSGRLKSIDTTGTTGGSGSSGAGGAGASN